MMITSYFLFNIVLCNSFSLIYFDLKHCTIFKFYRISFQIKNDCANFLMNQMWFRYIFHMKFLIAFLFILFLNAFGLSQYHKSDDFVKDPILTRYPVSRFLVF